MHDMKHERYTGPDRCWYCRGHKELRVAGTREKKRLCPECGGKGYILDQSDTLPVKKVQTKPQKEKTRAARKKKAVQVG